MATNQQPNMTYLFVYGTLMQNVPSRMAAFLRERSDFAGTAHARGYLYDLGRYPGLVCDFRAEDWVRGHVYRLPAPEAVMPELDAYEGIDPQRPQSNEYRRDRIPVRLQNTGEELECWAYQYNLPVDGLLRIPSGDYLQYLQQNPKHQRFIKNY